MERDKFTNIAELTTDELQLQCAFLRELSNVTVDMLNETDTDELIQRICERLKDVSGSCYTYIAIEHESGEYLDVKYAATDSEIVPRLLPFEGIGGTAWAEDRLVHTGQYGDFENHISSLDHVVQGCAIPLRCRKARRGVLGILYDDKAIDITFQLDLLKQFADVVAAALDNTRLHQSHITDLLMQEAMLKINKAIYESSAYTEILESVCDMILEGFNANCARVYRYDDGSFQFLAGRFVSPVDGFIDKRPDKKILCESTNMWTVQNLEAAHVKVETNDDRESPTVHIHRRREGIGCSYVSPLISNGEAWGVLSVHKAVGITDFSDSEMRLIDLLSSQLSVTFNRQKLMHEIEFQASHDPLTGCFNRSRFEQLLEGQVSAAKKQELKFSLLYIDLDGFKNVNDTLGHDAGDRVLVEVTSRIRTLLPDDMILARLGGDEFVIMSTLGHTQENTLKLANAISTSLCARESKDLEMTMVSASLGMATFGVHGNTARELLTCADLAMYDAKGSGPGEVREYDAQFGVQYKRRQKLKTRIEQALANDEFELHFQPKVRTLDGQVAGVEALIRWNEPEFAQVSPAEWIPLAEENGTIHMIGIWVMRQSILFLEEMEKKKIRLNISINISATQFDAPDFPRNILSLLETTSASTDLVEFEITETAVISDIQIAVSKLNEIRDAGIKISLDDFGVQNSSLAYLGDFPIDIVKVDRLFVQGLERPTGRPMLGPILRLAQSMELETVVEGVETVSQREAVIELGCDYIQGYYYSKPVPLGDIVAVIGAINSGIGRQAA